MKKEHKRIIRITQVLVVGLLVFALLGVLDGILWTLGDLSLTEAISYLEYVAGAEGLTISAYLYKRVKRGEFVLDEFWRFLLVLIGDVEDDTEIDERLRIWEREKLKKDLKGLRRR